MNIAYYSFEIIEPFIDIVKDNEISLPCEEEILLTKRIEGNEKKAANKRETNTE